MVDTLHRLMQFHGPQAKTIVWEHNTHIGDARATSMIRDGMINVGQLVNQQHKRDGVFSIGFGSYEGQVVAGFEWGDPMRIINVPEARPGSWEYILHQLGGKNRLIFMNKEMKNKFGHKEIGHRAIGVVYNPKYEYPGNYVPSLMAERYNAFIFLDKTTALHPLPTNPDGHQLPETFPFGT
jgi:erythromycin esterase-like protein